jgi:hypothetical protein
MSFALGLFAFWNAFVSYSTHNTYCAQLLIVECLFQLAVIIIQLHNLNFKIINHDRTSPLQP